MNKFEESSEAQSFKVANQFENLSIQENTLRSEVEKALVR